MTLAKVLISTVGMRKGPRIGDGFVMRLKCTGRHFLNRKALNGLFCKLKHTSKVLGDTCETVYKGHTSPSLLSVFRVVFLKETLLGVC